MKRYRLLVALVSLALVASGCFGPSAPPNYSAEINAFINDFAAAYEAMDAEALSNLFAEEVLYRSPIGDATYTRDQIEVLYELIFSFSVITEVNVKSSNVIRDGTTAHVEAVLEITVVSFSEGFTYDAYFQWTMKRIGGRWQITEIIDVVE